MTERNQQCEQIDPITLEVICESLAAIVKEMRASIIRASFSSAIYELDDFSCALFNPQADMVAQSDDHPGHVMPMPWSVQCAMEDFEGDIHPGDVIILNDAYRGGTHLNDVTLLYPIFCDGELFIFPAVRAHWADVGGMTPGSYSGRATTIYQEGVRIPPIKLYERGKPSTGVMRLLFSNMRLPDERDGDLNASLGACRVAEQRIRKLIEKFGKQCVVSAINENLSRSERRIRDRIRVLPDGEYCYEDYLEYYDGEFLDPVLMRLRLIINGDQVIADFEGSSDQVPGVVNSSLAVAGAGVFVAVKSTLDPSGPVNSGAFRAITLKAPSGSIVDVKYDAPAGAHGEVRKRVVSVMLGALSQVIPESDSGDLSGASFPNSIGGFSKTRNRPYVYIEVPAGGNGGFLEADGSNAFVNVDFGSIRSIHNVESLEADTPLIVERCVLRQDSGGEGTSRGGLGMQRELRMLEENAVYSVLGDRAVVPPFGVHGGGAAHQLGVKLKRDSGLIQFDTPGKVTGFRLRKDDVVVMESAGGGGYGDPLERDVQAVLYDVQQGYISIERARCGYGVVLDQKNNIDAVATLAMRETLRNQRIWLIIESDETYPYIGLRGKRRQIKLSTLTLQRLGIPIGSLVELVGKHPAPLRCWVAATTGSDSELCPMDRFGRKILGVGPGDRVLLRVLESHFPVERLAS